MKKKAVFGMAFAVLICILIALNGKILNPAEYSGVWYRVSDGACCVFQEGIIGCADTGITGADNEEFGGAYTFAKNRTAIFVIDNHGVGEVVELHLVRRPDGDLLCERRDGEDIIWFRRNG